MTKNLSPFIWLSSWPEKMRDTREKMSRAKISPRPTRPFSSKSQRHPLQERGMHENGAFMLMISSDNSICKPILCPERHLQNSRVPPVLSVQFPPMSNRARRLLRPCHGSPVWHQSASGQVGTRSRAGLSSAHVFHYLQLTTCSCPFMCKPQEQNAKKQKEKLKRKKKREYFQPMSGSHFIPM